MLAAQPTRRAQACYYSFSELGHTALALEDVCVCAAVQRSSIVAKARGGIAQVVGAIVKECFPTELDQLASDEPDVA